MRIMSMPYVPSAADIDAVMEKPKLDTPKKRKQYVESEFARMCKAYLSAGRGDAWTDGDKRKRATIATVERAEKELSSLQIRSITESLARFETCNFTNYELEDDVHNISLAAALWMLEDLRRTGKLFDAYDFLPTSLMDAMDVYIPTDFYHPCYEQDLIQSVASVVYKRGPAFRKIVELLNPEKVEKAAQTFGELQWKATELYLQCDAWFDRESTGIMKQLKSAMTPSVVMMRRTEIDERALAERGQEIEDQRRDFTSHFEELIGTGERRIFGSRELGRILEGFEVGDPFEICFAIQYLRSTDDPQIWNTKAGCAVASAAARLLPWVEEREEWEEGLQYNGNGWLDREPPPEKTDLYKRSRGEPNLAQRIYGLCRGIVPVGLHPFAKEREEMRAEGLEDADTVADWAEILYLSGFRAIAANLRRRYDWDDELEEEEEEELPALGGYWGQVAAEQGVEIAEPEEDNAEDLRAELDRARKEIKNLRKTIVEVEHDADSEKAKADKELKALRMEHRELADLRELVFNRENEVEEKLEAQIEYPYETQKRTVVFGGHDTFMKAIKPRLPNVKFVDAQILGFNPDIIRNADVVWIQNNCISHSQYWSIVKNCKLSGVQMRYFTYASAEKCAEQLVLEDRK